MFILIRSGEVAEWSKANDSKSFNRQTIRGFESHPLRFNYLISDAANENGKV